MLQSLAYRQAFFVLDLVLVGLIAYVGFVAFKGVLHAGGPTIAEPVGGDVAQVPHPTVGALADYELIVTAKLFGDPKPPPTESTGPVVPDTEIDDTTLPLKLGGTTVAGAVSSAIIEDESRRLADVYFLGQEIIPNVTLIEVRPDAVVLMNGTTNKKEILRREGEDEETTVATSTNRPSIMARRPVTTNSDGATVVNRQEVMQELSQNASKLLTEVKPEFKKDARGNTVGVTSSNISAIPMATQIGLQDNDVVTSINGERIDSEEKLSTLLQKYGNARTIRLGIERNGRPQVLNLRLE